MAAAEIEALKKVRNSLVMARRKLTASINAGGSSPDITELTGSVEQLSKLQVGIEAVDRAIRDEGGLAPGAVALSSAGRT